MKLSLTISVLFFILLIAIAVVQFALILAGSHAYFNFGDTNFKIGFTCSVILLIGAFSHFFFFLKNGRINAAAVYFYRFIYSFILLVLIYIAIEKIPVNFTIVSTILYGLNFIAIMATFYFIIKVYRLSL